MEFFKRMGDNVARRWKACNYDERRFPGIATEALAEYPPSQHLDLTDVVRWATASDRLPFQVDLDAKFGDPPLTVYLGRGFRIEVLFWLSGTPAIHQHSFSGAFHVMRGSSIHSIWSFEPSERVETRLLIGDVAFRNVEVLGRGSTRPILAGDEMYHATFHIDQPSVSVVVRTITEVDRYPQYNLLPPAIAHASQEAIPTIRRQCQLMRMAIRGKNRSEYQELAKHLFATKDALTTYESLMATYGLIEDEEEKQGVLQIARVKDSRLMKVLEPVILREHVRQKLLHVQKNISNPEIKYFVALLLSVPDGLAVMDWIKQRFPMRRPLDAVVGWVRELSEHGVFGFQFPEAWLIVLKSLLAEARMEGAISPFTGIELSADTTQKAARAIRESWLLGSLFRRDLRRDKVRGPHGQHAKSLADSMPASTESVSG